MARKRTDVATTQRGEAPRVDRLELIKKRHRELILKPREGLMDGLIEDEDAFHALDDPDEYHLIDEYDLQPEM